MKKYLCHVGGWKMYQLKGKSPEEIERLYYREFRKDKDFLPMHSEAEAKRYKRSGVNIESKETKKSKVEEKLNEEQGCSSCTLFSIFNS